MENIPISLKSILGTSWRFYKGNFKSIFIIILIVSLAGGLLSTMLYAIEPADPAYDAQIEELNQKIEAGEINRIGALLKSSTIKSSPQVELYEKGISLINGIIIAIAYFALIVLTIRRLSGEQISVKESFKTVWKRALHIIGTFLLLYVFIIGIVIGVVIIGFLGALLLGLTRAGAITNIGSAVWIALGGLLLAFTAVIVWLNTYLTFTFQGVMVRNKIGLGAMKYSWGLVKGHWWKTFGYTLAIGLVILLPIIILVIVSIPLAIVSGIFSYAILNLLNSLAISFMIIALSAMFSAYEQSRRLPT